MKYRFLEEIALADTAFEAFGKTEKELFENCAIAMCEVMCFTDKIEGKERVSFEIEEENLEKLLHKFLSEIVFLKDERETVFCRAEVKIENGKLEAIVFGQKVSELGAEQLKTDVKAVTWHKFGIEKNEKELKATVVLDV